MNHLNILGWIILLQLGNLTEAGFWNSLSSWWKTGYSDCTTKYNSTDISALQQTFRRRLHGQHLAQRILISALKQHLYQASPRKALVMSFHGEVGIGKTYAALIIAKTLCTKGRNSQNDHYIRTIRHFPHADNVNTYKSVLSNWIIGNVSKCAFNLFIIDEIDRMPLGLIDAIKPFIDSVESVDGVDYRHCIFIFLSNTGRKEIGDMAATLMSSGKERASIALKDVKELVKKGVYGNTGGLEKSAVLGHGLVDFYVPFLPLEESHVKLCIKDSFEAQKLLYDQHMIQDVLDLMDFSTTYSNISYSEYGCKPVYSNVGYVAASKDEL